MIRRIISGTLALALTLGGAVWLVLALLYGDPGMGKIFRLPVLAASLMIVFGVLWLWGDLTERWPGKEPGAQA
jgi:hypothetical protein